MVRILQAAKDQINAHFIAQKWLWMCKQQQLKLCGTQLQSSKQYSAKIFSGCVDKWRIELLSKKKKKLHSNCKILITRKNVKREKNNNKLSEVTNVSIAVMHFNNCYTWIRDQTVQHSSGTARKCHEMPE